MGDVSIGFENWTLPLPSLAIARGMLRTRLPNGGVAPVESLHLPGSVRVAMLHD